MKLIFISSSKPVGSRPARIVGSFAGLVALVVAWTAASLPPAFADAKVLEGSDRLHLLAEFGPGQHHRVAFDSTVIRDRVLIAVAQNDGTLGAITVAGECRVAEPLRKLATEIDSVAKPGAVATDSVGDVPIVLFGVLSLEAYVRDQEGWERFTLVPREDSGILVHRVVSADGGFLHVANLERCTGKREKVLDSQGRVAVRPAAQKEVLRYYRIAPGDASIVQSSEIFSEPVGLAGPVSMSIRSLRGKVVVLYSRHHPEGGETLDVFRSGVSGWRREALRRFPTSISPLVHLDENGVAYSRREEVGLSRIPLKEGGAHTETGVWEDWSPSALDSASGVLAWVDARRAGQRWWGRLPLHVLWNPDNSPRWLNNDILINRDDPRVLTPWPVRVEQFRVHFLGSRLVVLWLGYRNFNGRAEVFDREPLGLFCQAFDWKDVRQ